MFGWRRLSASAPPAHSLPLRLWTLAAVIVSVFAVTAHDDFLDQRLTVSILVAAGFAFSYWRREKRNWWVKIILAGLCLQVASQFLRDVVADPLHTSVPLTVFLLRLQMLHAFDVPARRDLLFSLLSSVILMAVAAAFSVESVYLAYLAAYAFAALQALVQNAWQASREAAGLPDDLSAARPAHQVLRSVAPVANHLLIVVLLVGAAAFLVTPRFEGFRLTALPFTPRVSWLDVFTGRIVNPAYLADGAESDHEGSLRWNSRGYYGFSPVVDLRLRGRLDDGVVMRVRASRQFNWRALIFDAYTGTGWRISDAQVTELEGTFPPLTIVHRGDEVLSYAARPLSVTQTFYVEREQPNVVFAAPLAERLYLPSGRAYLDRYGAIRLTNTLKPGTVYSVVSRVMMPDAARLRASPREIPAPIARRYLALPPLPERVYALARQLTSGEATQYDRVLAVNRFLWTRYAYDLTIPPQRRGSDAVDYFLFEERRGYCEQFASAMAVLLRAAGIPTRLVTGYAPGAANPVTGLLEVRNSDAHAWVEVYFPGTGWVDFEPTPGFLDTETLGRPPQGRWPALDFAEWARKEAERLLARSPHLASAADVAAWVAGWWGVLALAVMLGGLGFRRAAAWRHGDERSPTPLDALAGLYAEACAVLARRGLRRRPGETLAEFRQRIRAAGYLVEAEAILDLAESAAYAGRVPSDAELAAARADLAVLRRVARRRLSRHRRRGSH